MLRLATDPIALWIVVAALSLAVLILGVRGELLARAMLRLSAAVEEENKLALDTLTILNRIHKALSALQPRPFPQIRRNDRHDNN